MSGDLEDALARQSNGASRARQLQLILIISVKKNYFLQAAQPLQLDF